MKGRKSSRVRRAARHGQRLYVMGALASVGALSVLGTSKSAHAQTAVQTAPRETTYESRPNGGMIRSGVFTLGVPYVASVIVAAESPRSSDNHLYVPVAGPWLDLANRGECAAGSSCTNETLDKVLLVGDGVLQGIGALQILGGFVFPERHPVVIGLGSQHFVVTPARLAGGAYGISAAGTF